MLSWLGDKILQVIDARTKVTVLVHKAFFIDGSGKKPYYFVKVINSSPNAPFTITHVWVKDNSKEIDVLNPKRPLPHKLKPTDIWETWFSKDIIQNQDDIFNNVFIVLSNGKEYKSKHNKTVRSVGFVAK